MGKSERKTITDSLARLEITSEGEELVGTYELNASDERRAVGRYSSRLALAASFPMGTAAGQLRGRGTASSKWTYA